MVLYGPVSMMNHSCGSILGFILDKQQDKHRIKGSPKRAPQPINLSQSVTRVTLTQRSETGIDPPYKRLLNLRNDQLYLEKGAEITVHYAPTTLGICGSGANARCAEQPTILSRRNVLCATTEKQKRNKTRQMIKVFDQNSQSIHKAKFSSYTVVIIL